ncbi:MAG: hypothetical protein JSS66_04535 [Armatimonadetes bacterium]|nr:hypothetical protein [Armatimonadota bacterium]
MSVLTNGPIKAADALVILGPNIAIGAWLAIRIDMLKFVAAYNWASLAVLGAGTLVTAVSFWLLYRCCRAGGGWKRGAQMALWTTIMMFSLTIVATTALLIPNQEEAAKVLKLETG